MPPAPAPAPAPGAGPARAYGVELLGTQRLGEEFGDVIVCAYEWYLDLELLHHNAHEKVGSLRGQGWRRTTLDGRTGAKLLILRLQGREGQIWAPLAK